MNGIRFAPRRSLCQEVKRIDARTSKRDDSTVRTSLVSRSVETQPKPGTSWLLVVRLRWHHLQHVPVLDHLALGVESAIVLALSVVSSSRDQIFSRSSPMFELTKPSVSSPLPELLVGPLREAPRLVSRGAGGRGARPLSPSQDRQGQAQAGHRRNQSPARAAAGVFGRNRGGIRHRSRRSGTVVAARPRPVDNIRLGKLRQGVGDRLCEATEAASDPLLRRRLRPVGRPVAGRFRSRYRLHLERHDLRCHRSQCRLDRPPAPRAFDLRRDVVGLRGADAVGQARCGHVQLAESAGRRGAARDPDSFAARGRTPRIA